MRRPAHDRASIRPRTELAREVAKRLSPRLLHRFRRPISRALVHPVAASRAVFRPKDRYSVSGSTIEVPPSLTDLATRIELESGAYELPERLLVRRHARALRTVIELGSGVGAVTLAIASAAGTAEVFAVEASPAAVDVLRKNVSSLANVQVIHGFASVGASPSREFRYADSVLGGRVVDQTNASHITVDPVDLSLLLSRSSRGSTGLVIDIEGGEAELVSDLDKAGLLSRIDVLIAEWHPRQVGFDAIDRLRRLLTSSGLSSIEAIGQVEAWGRRPVD